MKQVITRFLFVFLCFILQPLSAEESVVNGKVKVDNQNYLAWNAKSEKWIKIEAFWQKFTEQNNGLTWKASAKYPPYNQLKEFDTFMAITDKGNCLMEFYHTRWRRANDVRRWDDKFNDYAGCPFVFD